jgi:glutamine synthetase
MDPRSVKTIADAKKIVTERKLEHVKVGLFDLDGVLRGKYMARDKFFSALDKGFGYCNVVLGWDVADNLYDRASATSWDSGFPDAQVRIVPESCRAIPFEGDMLLFLVEFDQPWDRYCPRGTLRRVIEYGQALGLKASAACEFEFFVFNETPETVRAKGYRNLETITPGMFGYSTIRNSVHADYYRELMQLGVDMDFPIEGLHTETGPGVIEAAIVHTEALAAADRAALFKTYAKIHAQRRNWMATFMAKWSPNYPGQSGHTHISLTDAKGKGVFYDAKKPHNISDTMRHFIGGQQLLMPQLLAMVACTVNSYTRLIPGFWAPTQASWGIENRTCALRAIPGSEKSQRVEYRIAAADINPYLAVAAALGSGLYGIKHKIEPTEPALGNAYEMKFPAKLALPRTLWDAAQNLKKSAAAREVFGDAFVDHYAYTREWEEREGRRAITDWQLARYFEII